GYSIYGGRAGPVFDEDKGKKKKTNRPVGQPGMEDPHEMTAHPDPRLWTSAPRDGMKGEHRNSPPLVQHQTHKARPLPRGKHVFLDPASAIKRMTVAKGMQVNLFASEKQFPELVNPVQMSWDTRGRLWVAVWPTYPHWKPKEKMNDKILILEDTDGDGV